MADLNRTKARMLRTRETMEIAQPMYVTALRACCSAVETPPRPAGLTRTEKLVKWEMAQRTTDALSSVSTPATDQCLHEREENLK